MTEQPWLGPSFTAITTEVHRRGILPLALGPQLGLEEVGGFWFLGVEASRALFRRAGPAALAPAAANGSGGPAGADLPGGEPRL